MDHPMATWASMTTAPLSPHLDGVLLRMAHADDDADLIDLAALDSARPLLGPALLAEENGALVAALCLSTGRAVANPFVPSLHIVELLRQHAAQRQASAAALGRRRTRFVFRAGWASIGERRSW
jgi:hypothetical protein